MGSVWVGTSGFAYKEWRPAFYPADLREKDFLRFYASRLNSVEIDSSFYRMPKPETLASWRDAAGDRFRFALKTPRRITHVERLRLPSGALDHLLGLLPSLRGGLGPLLVQLPPTLARDLGRLDAFLAVLSRAARAAVEFRHPSWHVPETYEVLRAHGAALCVADTDEGTSPLQATAPFVYVRLRRSAYDPSALDGWRRRMRVWEAGGLDVFAYVKHRDNPGAPRIAETLAPRREAPVPVEEAAERDLPRFPIPPPAIPP